MSLARVIGFMGNSGFTAMHRALRAPLDLLVWLLALVGTLLGAVVIAVGLVVASLVLNLVEVAAWLGGRRDDHPKS